MGSGSTFTSPATETWPTLNIPEFEEVHRTIFFDLDKITVVTETAIGKEIREFQILSVEQINGNLKFYCSNRDETEKIIVIIPEQQKFIDIYQPSQTTGKEIQVRLHVDPNQ